MDKSPEKRKLRFSLKILLAVVTAVALYFGGYSDGYHNGYSEGKRASKADYVIFNQVPPRQPVQDDASEFSQ